MEVLLDDYASVVLVDMEEFHQERVGDVMTLASRNELANCKLQGGLETQYIHLEEHITTSSM